MSKTTEEIENGRRSLVAQLKQAVRRADLEEYPVDVATMRDLIEVLEAVQPRTPGPVCSNCDSPDFTCAGCGVRLEVN